MFPWAAEDPCIFQDPDSKYFHILAHRTGNASHQCADVSAHAVAASPGGPWRVTEEQPYSRDIQWEGNVTAHVQKRERPQIVFDRQGRAVALTNGVMPGAHSTPVSPGGHTGDWSYTHIQLLAPAAATWE